MENLLFSIKQRVYFGLQIHQRVAENPVAQLLQTGNLVLKDDIQESSQSYLWQSFDHPTDSMLAGMKIGKNLKIGLERYFKSWESVDDPSIRDFTYRIEVRGLPQMVVSMGSEKRHRSGPWNGTQNNGLPMGQLLYLLRMSCLYCMSLTMNHSGLLQRLVLHPRSSEWVVMYSNPDDPSDSYGQCGVNDICKINKSPICECLTGFAQKSQEKWKVLDASDGCMRRMSLGCHSGEVFVKVAGVKFPDLIRVSFA